MKSFLATLLLLCTFFCKAQINGVSDFNISTTLNNFYKISGYDKAKENIITSESAYENIWVKYYFDSAYHDTKIYSINFDKINLENYGWKLTSSTNVRTKVFYITQLPIKEYTANNILLIFYNNILTKIEYDLPANLFDSLSLYNQKDGDSSTETKTLSKCKATKSYNVSKTVTMYNKHNRSQSVLEYIEGTDAACKSYSHLTIKIINLDFWQQYLADAKASLPSIQQKVSDEMINQQIRELEAKNKKNKKK